MLDLIPLFSSQEIVKYVSHLQLHNFKLNLILAQLKDNCGKNMNSDRIELRL